jgi:hypothetical protein
VSADDTHHFHYLFTSLRIKEQESATNYLRRFTFARTEVEGAGNVYTKQALVNFALAGLATTKNPKYDTAVQLFNLERDSGKIYSLEDIEKKFFAIDEKTGRETVSARIAQGHVAMGQRGINVIVLTVVPETLVVMATGNPNQPMQPPTPPLGSPTRPVSFVERRGILHHTAPTRRKTANPVTP